MQLYNDGEMVMTRFADWNRYRQSLQVVRLGTKIAKDGRLLARGKAKVHDLPRSGDDGV